MVIYPNSDSYWCWFTPMRFTLMVTHPNSDFNVDLSYSYLSFICQLFLLQSLFSRRYRSRVSVSVLLLLVSCHCYLFFCDWYSVVVCLCCSCVRCWCLFSCSCYYSYFVFPFSVSLLLFLSLCCYEFQLLTSLYEYYFR